MLRIISRFHYVLGAERLPSASWHSMHGVVEVPHKLPQHSGCGNQEAMS